MNPVMVVRPEFRNDVPCGRGLWLWCPGCNEVHRPSIVGEDGSMPEGPCWTWNGDLERPTIEASILVYGAVYTHDDGTICPDWHDDYETRNHTQGNCHSFVRDGQWEFLSDSAHALSGQTVPMVPLPDWLCR